MEIMKKFLTPNKWSRPQLPMDEVKAVVIHWVNAPKQEAANTWEYFESLKHQEHTPKDEQRFGSAQFIIGLKGEVIQTMPLSEKAYAVGLGGFEPQPLYKSMFNSSPNRHTISIECNHLDSKGTMSKETYASLIALVLKLCKEYKLNPLTQVLLHNDITSKICHKYFVDNKAEWQSFKQSLVNMLKVDGITLEKGIY